MRTSFIALSFLMILPAPCFANGMEAPAQAATPGKAATPAARAERAAKAETAAKAEAAPKAQATPNAQATPKAPAAPGAETAANGNVATTAKRSAPKLAAPALPDDLTPRPIRHVAICPPPKIAPCVMRKPVTAGYRVLTNGVDVADDGANWLVDFGRGPKESRFLLQILETGSSLHDIEVRFQTKPGMQKTPTLPE